MTSNQIYTAQNFIDDHKNLGWHRTQVRKLLFLARMIFDLDPANVAVAFTTDPKWITRRNRTPLEKAGIKFGHSIRQKHGHEIVYVLWAYPLISVPNRATEEKQRIMASYSGHQRKPPRRGSE